MVYESVEQGGGELLAAEDLDPFAEGQVRGDDGRAVLVAVGQQVEQEFSAGPIKGNEAELVEDQQVDLPVASVQARELTVVTGFDQPAHEVRGPGEDDTPAVPCRLDSEGDRQMIFFPLSSVIQSHADIESAPVGAREGR